MGKSISEEKGGPHLGHAAGDTDLEKQASQLASDVKYKVKKKLGKDTNLNPAQIAKAYLAMLAASPAPSAVKILAKKKITGEGKPMKEDYTKIDDLVVNNVASALYKVFVEGVGIEEENLQEESDDKKYFVRVTDKKTGNTYRRWATRDKITELRANPNISSVEMTEYGEAEKAEKEKGEQTSKVKSGKGLDPVGKEDSDVNNDGKVDKTDKYLKNRRDVRGAAIASRHEQFNVIGEASKAPKNDSADKKIDIMKGENKVDVFPEIKVQEQVDENGFFIVEKARSKAQQRFMGMVYAAKKGEKAASPEVAQAAGGMSKKEAKKFAKTKHKGLPEKIGEEKGCESSDTDPRQNKTKIENVKNKFRAMGLKMSYEPEGEQIDEIAGALLKGALAAGALWGAGKGMESAKKSVDAKINKARETSPIGGAKRVPQINSYEPEGEIVDEGRGEYRSLGRADQNRGRNRYMGGGTPDDIADEKKRGDAAAAAAVAKLRRRRAAEEARKKER
jgi:hypothetical protein